MISNLSFILRRRWPILLAIPLLSVVAVFVATPDTKEEAPGFTTTLFLAGDPDAVSVVGLEQAAVDIRQPAVAEKAAAELDLEGADLQKLPGKLKTKVDTESLTIRLSVTDDDRDFVANYLEAFANGYIDVDQSQANAVLEADLTRLEKARDQAQVDLARFIQENEAQLNAIPPDAVAVVQRGLYQDRVTAAEQAVLDQRNTVSESRFRIARVEPVREVTPSKLRVPQNRLVLLSFALVISLLGAIVVVAIVEKLNPRVDNPQDAANIIGAPVLAMVPIVNRKRHKLIERADLRDFSGPFAESFRSMRSHLDFRSATQGLDRPPCVMVVSAAPAEGKTTSAAFLALSYAEVGRETLVIGADFRRPAVHRHFGVPRSPGLSSRTLTGEEADWSRTIVRRDERTGVRVVPSGPGTDRVAGLLGDLRAVVSAGLAADCTVVIDTAPIMVANDAIDYLPMVDWVVVVARLGRTTQRALAQTIANLELNDATIAGCVVIGSLESSDAKRYYYSYYNVDEPAADGAPSPSAAATVPDSEPTTTPDPEPAPTPTPGDH